MYESKYEVNIYDIDGETVAWASFDSESDAEEMYNMLSVGAGGSAAILKYNYKNDKYVNTEVVASKK